MTQPSHRDLTERYRVLEALIRSAVDAAPGSERGDVGDPPSASESACHPGRPVPLAGLDDELRRVHRMEQARLLGDAAELALTRSASDLLRPLPGIGGRRAWRADAWTELRLAAADGLDAPRALSESVRARADVPGAGRARLVDLASTALELRPGARARLTLARVLVRVGRERDALLQLSAIDAERACGRGLAPPAWMPAWIDAEAERCRAAAYERLGELARAGAALDRVLTSVHGDASDAALALGIALVREDERAARRAAAAVGRHGAGVPPATLALVSARLSAWHRSRRVAPEGETSSCTWDRVLFELLCEGTPGVVAIAFAHLAELFEA